MDTRITLAEQVLSYINGQAERGRDESVDIREVFVKMDQTANHYARLGRLEAMKEGVYGISPCYLLLYPGIVVVANGDESSKAKVPNTYQQLTHNRGLVVYPENELNDTFVAVPSAFAATHSYSIAGNLENRVGYYVRYFNDGPWVIFSKPIHQGTKLIKKVDMNLAIIDSSVLTDEAPYPIDPQWTKTFIEDVANWFLLPKQLPVDLVNDGVTQTPIKQ